MFAPTLALTFPSLDLSVLEEGSVRLDDVVLEIFEIVEDDAILDFVAPVLKLFLGHGLLVIFERRTVLFREGHYRLLGLFDLAHFLLIVEDEDLWLLAGRLLRIGWGGSGRDVLLVAEVRDHCFGLPAHFSIYRRWLVRIIEWCNHEGWGWIKKLHKSKIIVFLPRLLRVGPLCPSQDCS